MPRFSNLYWFSKSRNVYFYFYQLEMGSMFSAANEKRLFCLIHSIRFIFIFVVQSQSVKFPMFCTFHTNEGSNILGVFTVVHCVKGIRKSKRHPSRLPNQQNTKHHLQPSQDRHVTTVARLSAIGVKSKTSH